MTRNIARSLCDSCAGFGRIVETKIVIAGLQSTNQQLHGEHDRQPPDKKPYVITILIALVRGSVRVRTPPRGSDTVRSSG